MDGFQKTKTAPWDSRLDLGIEMPSRSLAIFVSLILLGLANPFLLCSGSDASTENHWDRIDDVLRAEVTAGDIPGAVVLVGKQDEVLYHKAFGYAVIEPYRREMTRETLFDLASLTKPLATASSVLLLASQEKLHLEDRVSVYLPEYGCLGKEDTQLKHLLTHTSGLPAYTNAADLEARWGPVCPEGVIETICGLQALSAPGETFRYSCLGYIIAAHIVEIVSGKNVAAFSQEFVFRPLGMERTGFVPAAATRPRIAATELVDDLPQLGQVHDPLARCMGGVSGNAGLFSNALDLSLFCRMLLNQGVWNGKRILSREAVTLLTEPQSHGRAYGFDIGSAYAWIKGPLESDSAFCHSGYTGTSLVCDPVTEKYLIILTNRVHPRDEGSCRSLREALAGIVFQSRAGDISEATSR